VRFCGGVAAGTMRASLVVHDEVLCRGVCSGVGLAVSAPLRFRPPVVVNSTSVVTTLPLRDAVHTPVRRLGRNWIATSLGAAAVLYSAWVLQFPLHLDIDPVHAYVSELAALTRVDHRLFACTDLAAGLLALGTAAVVLLTRSPGSVMTRIGWSGFAGFGLSTVADSLLPLPCAPHADPGCAIRGAAHELPITDTLHVVSSATAIAALLVAIGSFTLATNLGTRAHRAGIAVTVTAAATTVWTLAEVIMDDTIPAHEHVGLAQRLQLLALAVGVCYIATRAQTADDDPAQRAERLQ